MQDILKLVRAELRSAWRFRWHALSVAWMVCVLGWLAIYMTPDTYEARARFYLDATSAFEPVVKGLTVDMDEGRHLDLVRQVVLGRDALIDVARKTHLSVSTATPQDLDAVVEKLSTGIQLTGGNLIRQYGGGRDPNFAIAYRDTDRQRAVQVVQAVLDNFIENTVQERNSGFRSVRQFLEEQIRLQEQRLTEAEQRLADFKRRNIGNLPTQAGDYVSSLQGEMSQLQTLRSQQRVLESRRQQLTAQMASEKQYIPSNSLPAPVAGGRQTGADGVDGLIIETQSRLDALLRVYTPKHPEVVALEESLTQLRARRREELTKLGATDIPEHGGLALNPVYEQIRLQRNDIDVELAAVRGQITERAARVQDMRSQLETVPEVEAELAQLTRDYDVLRERYVAMLQRLETAKMSDAVGESDELAFSLISPPTALAGPVAPPRLMLLFAVLMLGLGAGAALAFVMSKLHPVFDSQSALKNLTGLSVLGAVTATWLDRRKARRRVEVVRVAATGAALMILFIGVVLAREVGSRFFNGLTG